MAGSDRRDTGMTSEANRGRRGVPMVLRMVLAILIAALLALGASYGLRSINL